MRGSERSETAVCLDEIVGRGVKVKDEGGTNSKHDGNKVL